MKHLLLTLTILTAAALTPVATMAAPAQQAMPTASTAPIPAGSYKIDRAHSSLIFRLNHMGFSNFTSRFKHIEADLQFDPARPEASQLTATVDANSLETDYPDPKKIDFNAMLKGDQWLDTKKFPQIVFKSTKITLTGKDTADIMGTLTMHGVTRPQLLQAKFNGGYAGIAGMDPNARIGFSAYGNLKRSDFGISFGIPAPGSNMGVSDNVEIIIESEFTGPALKTEPAK